MSKWWDNYFPYFCI